MSDDPTRKLGVWSVGLLAFGVAFTALILFMAASSAGYFHGGGDDDPEASAAESVDMEGAQQIFSTRCITCHGPQGEGNGPASAGLSPHPRNFTDPTWQDSVTDEHIESIIVRGGAAVGLSPAMPNNPDLRDKPEVVAGLRRMVRSFGHH